MLDRSYVENLVRAALTQIANAPAPGVAPGLDRAQSASPALTIQVPRRESSAVSTLISAPVPSKPVYRLDKRLVSVADLSGHLSERTALALRRGTVITPSAKDWLRQREIEIDWDGFDSGSGGGSGSTSGLSSGLSSGFSGGSSGRRAGIQRLLLVNALTRWDAQALGSEWVKAGLELEVKSFGCLIETTEFLKSELGSDGQAVAVVVTPHTDAALCLFNRQSNLRAIESSQAMTTEQKAAAIGANVLAVNGPKLGVFVARQIVRHFVGKAPWEIPAALRGVLT